MSIYDLRELFIDTAQMCYIWALDSEEEIFRGSMDDIDDDLLEEEVSSLDNVYRDNNGYIGINIER